MMSLEDLVQQAGRMVRRLERYNGFDVARTSSVMELEPVQRLQGRSDVVTFGVCYHTAKSILDVFEMPVFSLGETEIK